MYISDVRSGYRGKQKFPDFSLTKIFTFYGGGGCLFVFCFFVFCFCCCFFFFVVVFFVVFFFVSSLSLYLSLSLFLQQINDKSCFLDITMYATYLPNCAKEIDMFFKVLGHTINFQFIERAKRAREKNCTFNHLKKDIAKVKIP